MYWVSHRHRTVPGSRAFTRTCFARSFLGDASDALLSLRSSTWAAAVSACALLAACGDAKTGVCVATEPIDLHGDAIGFEVVGTDTGSPTSSTATRPPDGSDPGDSTPLTAPTSEDSVSDAPTTASDAPVDTVADAQDSGPDADDGGPELPPPCPWESWNDGLVGGRIDLVAFDPRDPGTAWASSGSVLIRSTDGGLTWEERSEDAALAHLAFPADDPKALLGGGASGLYASHDNGRSLDELALDGLAVSALLAHPANPQRVFVGTMGAGILRSDDGGVNFAPRNVGVPRANILSFAAPPDDPDLLLAGLANQTDTLGPDNAGALLRTTDGGLHWTTVSTDVSWGTRIAFCPSDSARVVASVRRGVLVSSDRGATWSALPIVAALDVTDVAFAAGDCDRLYLSVYQRGVYRLDDAGVTLTGPLASGFDLELGRFQATLAAHPSERGTVLAATTSGLYRSTDAGLSWRLMNVGRGMLAFDVGAGAGRAYLATWGSGLWTRTAELPWTRVAKVPRDFVQSVSLDPDDAERAAVGATPDAWLTESGANGFVASGPGPTNLLATLWLEDGTLLAGTQVSGVLRSTDGGAHWTPSNDGLTPSQTTAGAFIDVRALVRDPTTPGRVYAALYQGGVARSDDLGAHWTQPNDTLRDEKVGRVAVDVDATTGGAILYALVGGKGVYRSDDGGANWRTDGAGLATNDVGDMLLDSVSHTLYLAAPGTPTHRSGDGLTWEPFDGYCQPLRATQGLAIFEDDDGQRWLIAVGNEHAVIRHRL